MVISPSVDSMKLTASPNNTLTSLDNAIPLVDAVVDAVGLEFSCVASSVGVGVRSSSAACKKAKLMILSSPDIYISIYIFLHSVRPSVRLSVKSITH